MDQRPPGPRGISPLHILRMMVDPHGANARLTRKYGDPFLVQTAIGPMAVTSHPDGVRDFFTADPNIYEYCAPEMEAPLFGETALVFASGERHKAARKIVAPAFHRGRMKRYAAAIEAAALREASRWSPGQTIDLLKSAQTISLEVLLRTIFGLSDDESIQAFSAAALGLGATISPLLLVFSSLRRRFGGVGPYARFLRASDRLDALIYAEIDARRRRGAEGDDILSLMVGARHDDGTGMDDTRLRDEVRVLLFAGHETTAVAIAWAFYHIHFDPSVRERLLAELDASGEHPDADVIASLPYLDAVCQETLRARTILPEIARKLRAPLELRGYRLEAGISVMAAASLLHEREDLYPEPHVFRPERFLERTPSPYEFIPFGGGSHRCLGAAFAMSEIKLVLATLLRRYELRLATSQPIQSVRRGITMGPRGGVPMIYVGPTGRSKEAGR